VKRTSLLLVLLGTACRQDMHDQPRLEPLEGSSLFEDGRASRPRPPGTIARGERTWDAHLMEGKLDGELAPSFPMPITAEVLARGQQRFDIFCSVCHDRAGTGNGLVVERGLKQPPSFHIERLRAAPPGYLFDVITRGYGSMYDLSDKLTPADRWAVVAYVRALQRSRNATLADVTPEVRERLEREAGR